jgi:hypothetical protein
VLKKGQIATCGPAFFCRRILEFKPLEESEEQGCAGLFSSDLILCLAQAMKAL